MQCKADIVGILDMDGFQIGKKFFCKELGVIKVGDSEASSFFFDIREVKIPRFRCKGTSIVILFY
jgi:hypothetical protein